MKREKRLRYKRNKKLRIENESVIESCMQPQNMDLYNDDSHGIDMVPVGEDIEEQVIEPNYQDYQPQESSLIQQIEIIKPSWNGKLSQENSLGQV